MDQTIDLATLLHGRYLRDEARYDKWGAQGKVLLLLEVLSEERFPIEGLPVDHIVNSFFPRTFYCERQSADLDGTNITTCYDDVYALLIQNEVRVERASQVALEETAERFCTTIDRIRSLL